MYIYVYTHTHTHTHSHIYTLVHCYHYNPNVNRHEVIKQLNSDDMHQPLPHVSELELRSFLKPFHALLSILAIIQP